MSYAETAATVVGSALFIGGIALSTAFIGRGTRDPVATLVLGDYSLLVAIAGILGGLVVMACGLVIGVRVGNMEKYHEGTDDGQ
ncbi:hypothetical protein HWV23_01790 [Natronomonas halophila]|uniref:hypothetical protein n=1 Tax=Natronomonas halophila TaxID=2747817 RepID=UPI0015B6F01B|nr:hypothetical protein [Natronomonas halophila]QLD84490.1 hypothetical protein HWV23_01790 [Natronomonas halophila]